MAYGELNVCVNRWIGRAHCVTGMMNNYVEMISGVYSLDMYENLLNIMDMISNRRIISKTKWYIPHLLVPIINLSFKMDEVNLDDENFINCKKIIKNCIRNSIKRCDTKTRQNLFLQLKNDARVYIKDVILKT